MNRNQESASPGQGDISDAGTPGRHLARPEYLPAPEDRLPVPLADDDEDQADLTADIFPTIPAARSNGLRLPGANGRISVAELEGHHVHQGMHPGDRFVRRARPADEGFRRLGP